MLCHINLKTVNTTLEQDSENILTTKLGFRLTNFAESIWNFSSPYSPLYTVYPLFVHTKTQGSTSVLKFVFHFGYEE